MDFQFGAKIKPKDQAWLQRLVAPALRPEDTSAYIVRINRLRGYLNYFALLPTQVLVIGGLTPAIAYQFARDTMTACELQKRASAGYPYLMFTVAGETYDFGTALHRDDVPVLTSMFEVLQQQASARTSTGTVGSTPIRGNSPAVKEQALAGLDIVDGPLKPKPQRLLLDHLNPGERPWFVLNAGSAGVLACLDDRLMIIKAGGMAGMMAGATGGGRATTMYYREITGIEYNSGFANGVLEISTPSYQASGNKDFWRGSTSSRNANSADPWNLSNTLPLPKVTYSQCSAQFNELRRRISEAKNTVIQVSMPSPTPTSASSPTLAAEFAELAQLHSQGVLTDDEFTAAKAALLSRG